MRIGLLCLLLPTLTPFSRGAELYVSPGGSDGGAGTRQSPFATVQRAQQAAAPGDTVFIRGGTYRPAESQLAYRNGSNFTLLGRLSDNRTDVDGYGHKLRNNLSYNSRALISRLDATKSDASNNSFDLGLKLSDKDFASLDESELVQPRQDSGDLPAVRFLHPAPGSVLIDAGADVGFPFRGAAPDQGAFEASGTAGD